MEWCKVLIHKLSTKMTIYADFNLISSSWQNPRWQPLLVTSQASSSATIHKIHLFLLRKSKDFHLRQNRFEILQHIKNSGEGFHPPPPPSRYHGGDMNLLVRPRVILGINKGCFAVSPWLKHALQSRCTDHECMYFYHIAPAWSNMKTRKLITFQTFL